MQSLHIHIVLETVCLKQYDHVSILDDIVLTRVSYLCRLILHPPFCLFLFHLVCFSASVRFHSVLFLRISRFWRSLFIFSFNSLFLYRVSVLVQIPHAVIFFPPLPTDPPASLLLFQFNSIRHTLLVSEPNAELPKQIESFLFFLKFFFTSLSPHVFVSRPRCVVVCV